MKQTSDELRSELLPNTFPVPNWIVDLGIWALLIDQERTCYVIVVRKTLGWWKRDDRIAKSQLVELSGFSGQTVTKAMASLVEFGLVLRVDENDAKNRGIKWGYQPDHRLVDIEGLLERFEAVKKTNAKRAAKMREKATAGGYVGHTPPVGHVEGGDVTHETQKPNKPKRSGAGAPSGETKIPEVWQPLYDAFVEGFKRKHLDDRELRFWMFGSSAARGNAKGLKHYEKAGITPDDIADAWSHCKRERLTIANPNSLFPFADQAHRTRVNQMEGDESLEDTRERVKRKIQQATKEQTNA